MENQLSRSNICQCIIACIIGALKGSQLDDHSLPLCNSELLDYTLPILRVLRRDRDVTVRIACVKGISKLILPLKEEKGKIPMIRDAIQNSKLLDIIRGLNGDALEQNNELSCLIGQIEGKSIIGAEQKKEIDIDRPIDSVKNGKYNKKK